MTVCSQEVSVSPHANGTGTASGWFQLSLTQDSAGSLKQAVQPIPAGKGRERAAVSFGTPTGGLAPADLAHRTERGLPGGIILSTAAAAAL